MDRYIKANKIPLNDKEKAKLAHYNLLQVINRTGTVDVFLAQEEMDKLLYEKREEYYLEFNEKEKNKEKVVETLEIAIVDYYFKKYKGSFKY